MSGSNSFNVRETCSNTNALSRKNNDCIFHNSLPEVLPPLVRGVDLSGNFFGDALPRLLGTYVNLEVREPSVVDVHRQLSWRVVASTCG